MIQAQLFGRFEVQANGQPLDLRLRQVQGILAYLLLNAGHAHRREVLAGLFWPDANESNARSNLRHALWRIRKVLEATGESGSQRLETDDLSVRLHLQPGDWLDVAVLEEKARPGSLVEDLKRQVQVYQGELLPGFYDDWVALERERLASVYEHKMTCLLEALLRQGRWSEAATWAETWIASGSAPEPGYRALMLAHAARGNLPGVNAVYQRCREALAQDLGIEPSSHTQVVYEGLSRGIPPGQVFASLKSQDGAPLDAGCVDETAGMLETSPAAGNVPPDLQSIIASSAGADVQPTASPTSSLPIPLTRFIGRQAEQAAVLALLSGQKRLVTLTGAGGCGKTRLAIQVADLAIQSAASDGISQEPQPIPPFTHGAWFVDLSPLTNPGLIAPTILDVLGLRQEGDRPAEAVLEDYLQSRDLLLVLDNCEHLVAGCASLVQRLLQRCPHLVILATSREALDVPGEAVHIVPPLGVPEQATPTGALQSEAVQLFFERAGSPAGSKIEAQALLAAQICRQLDGIPLAIELAAAPPCLTSARCRPP